MNAFSLHWISVWIPLFKWLFLLFSHQTQQCLNHCVICFDGDQEVSIKVEIIVKCLLFMNFLLFIIFYWIFYYILYKCFSKVHEWKDWGENSMNNFPLIYIMLNHLRLFWKSVVFFHLDNFILIGGFFLEWENIRIIVLHFSWYAYHVYLNVVFIFCSWI